MATRPKGEDSLYEDVPQHDPATAAGAIIPAERTQECIYLFRKQKVMPDSDLAKLHGVETKALVRAVTRHREPGLFRSCYRIRH